MLVERDSTRLTASTQTWVWSCPLWILTAATIGLAVLVHGYEYSTAMPEAVKIAADPFTQNMSTGSWGYQSALGPMVAWAFGMTDASGVAAVHFLMTCAVVLGAAYALKRWHSDFAARLFLVAFFCSPQSWAAVAYLGLFDIITVAGLSVVMVAPWSVVLPVAVVLGFNHFEQAAIASAAIIVFRRMRGDEWRRSAVSLGAGLMVGKIIVTAYLVASGIDTNGRLDFIRDQGVSTIIDGWRGHERVILWAVFNVLWVGVIWMLQEMDRSQRATAALVFLVLTLPVLITFDLSRVYRTTTWPVVMLLVLFAAEHVDRERVQQWALILVLAACFVPRTEIWHGGLVLN